MPVGSAVAGIAGAGISAWGSNKAAKTQARAAREASAAATEAMAPYAETGKGAVYSLAQLYGIPTSNNQNPGGAFNEESLAAFRRSPDYSFAFDEGKRALEFGAASKGGFKSGNTMRDLTSFGQGMATQNFGNYFSRLMQLAQLGSGAAGTTAQAQSQGILGAGQATAAGTVGATNAINSGIGNTANNLMLYNLLNKNGGSVYGGQSGGSTFSYTPAAAGELPWQSASLGSYGQGGIGSM